jgi:uncharacterized protein
LGAGVNDRFARVGALKSAKRWGTAGANPRESAGTLRNEETGDAGAREYAGIESELRGMRAEVPEVAERLAKLLGATPRGNKYGEHLGLRRWFSEAAGLGAALGSAPEAPLDGRALRLLAPDAPEMAANPEQWLFLDTETTGLAGGTGTYAFLVGIAWWDAGGLEVEQFFMREHSEEHSLLVALAERMAERRVLVTFNGKAFDWPLLETRFRMTRAIRPPTPRAHLDFLHPARSLWRLRLGSVRLAELEKHVLGWNRGVDVTSELIPEIYFNFLRGGSAEPLVPVFLHNQMDLRGLAALAERVVGLLADAETKGQDAFELYGVSRICERRGEAGRARRLYERSIGAELPAEADRVARSSLARLAKREGNLAQARELWEGMLGNSKEGIEAYEQLAIHYEHRAREPKQAAAIVRRALAELRKSNRLGMMAAGVYRRVRERFQHRLARLERSLGKTRLDAIEVGGETNWPESE